MFKKIISRLVIGMVLGGAVLANSMLGQKEEYRQSYTTFTGNELTSAEWITNNFIGSGTIANPTLQDVVTQQILEEGYVFVDYGASVFEDDGGATSNQIKIGGYEWEMRDENADTALIFRSPSAAGADDGYIKIADSRTNPEGIQYSADYCTTLTGNSLINKACVEGIVTSGSLKSGNLITINGSNEINLGGTATNDAEIYMDGNSFMVQNNHSLVELMEDEIMLDADGASINLGGTISSNVFNSTTDNSQFVLYSDRAVFQSSNTTTPGIMYSMSAGHNYEPLSLVPLEYISGMIDTATSEYLPLVGNTESTRVTGPIRIDSEQAISWSNYGTPGTPIMQLYGYNGGAELYMQVYSGAKQGRFGIEDYTPTIYYDDGINSPKIVSLTNSGFVYENDYSTLYGDRSLVDKGYVDTKIQSGINSVSIPLGDVLQEGHSTDGHNIFVEDGDKIWFGVDDNIAGQYIEGEAGGDIIMNAGQGSFNFISDGFEWNGDTFIDHTIDKNGMTYGHDYCTGAIDRSLLDKKCIVSTITGYIDEIPTINIYSSDGTLTGDRIVDGGGNSMTINNTLNTLIEGNWVGMQSSTDNTTRIQVSSNDSTINATDNITIGNDANEIVIGDIYSASYDESYTTMDVANKTFKISLNGGSEIFNMGNGAYSFAGGPGEFTLNSAGFGMFSPGLPATRNEMRYDSATKKMTVRGQGGVNIESNGDIVLSGDSVEYLGSVAVNTYGVALGKSTQVTQKYGVAMGYSTKVYGTGSTALGYMSISNGDYSTAMGNNTKANGQFSTVMGFLSEANGDFSVAGGVHAEANGFRSIAFGGYAIASGDSSVALGDTVIANGEYSTAIGHYNKGNTDTLLEVGNGTATTGFNQFEFKKDGRFILSDDRSFMINASGNLDVQYLSGSTRETASTFTK